MYQWPQRLWDWAPFTEIPGSHYGLYLSRYRHGIHYPAPYGLIGMKNLAALISGILFGLGLALSGMTDTSKVIGFLDITGRWDPDLIWVMASAVLVSVGLTPLILSRARPLLAGSFSVPANSGIDRQLIFGAVIFGCGWGLLGYCPGPAIAALPLGDAGTLVFLLCMMLGMWLSQLSVGKPDLTATTQQS